MFFKRKNKNQNKENCPNCKSGLDNEFSYCPYCGFYLLNKEKEMKDFGLLGRKDYSDRNSPDTLMAQSGNGGISDKIISSLMNSFMKSLDKQFKEMDKEFSNAEVKPIPNGISIRIGQGNKQMKNEKTRKESSSRKIPTAEQLKKISSLPRMSAKSDVKRLGNKIVYELGMSGIKSPEDIFVSKLENGYEIKAISDKHVYVNTIPLDLPVKTFKIDKDKITLEFKTEY